MQRVVTYAARLSTSSSRTQAMWLTHAQRQLTKIYERAFSVNVLSWQDLALRGVLATHEPCVKLTWS